MKNARHTSYRAAGVAGALALLAAAPHAASAQAVGGYMRSGARPAAPAASPVQPSAIQPAPVRPGPVNAPSQYAPMRPGRFFGPSAPIGNRPVYSPPTYNNGPVYNNGPMYNTPAYNTGTGLNLGNQGYTNGRPGYSNGYNDNNGSGDWRSTGPVVTLPDASQAEPNHRMHRPRPNPSAGAGEGFYSQPVPPVSPGVSVGTVINRPRRPINSGGSQSEWQGHPDHHWGDNHHQDYGNNYVYNNFTVNPYPIIAGGPPLLGGYYYGNYSDTYAAAYTYPSVYSVYSGFPQYIFNPGVSVTVIGQPYYPPYVTSYLPFYTPSYSATYNQNNYYVASEGRARDLEAGGDRARVALRNAYPADSYQAAFGDIARAWMDDDVDLLKKHIRDTDTRVSISLNTKYAYSIASGDFVQITRDALDRLHTVSFDFTRLRKAKTGDVTAYGTHVYRVEAASPAGDDAKGKDGDTVPFDQNGSDADRTAPYDKSTDPTDGVEKTVYVSYTLRHRGSVWYIIGVDSSNHSLVPEH